MSNTATLDRPTISTSTRPATTATARLGSAPGGDPGNAADRPTLLGAIRPVPAAPRVTATPHVTTTAHVPAAPRLEQSVELPPTNKLPEPRAPRGFALYVGLDEEKAAAAGISLPALVDALRRTIADLAPAAETHATVALAPREAGGRDLDVVRLALQEPGAIARAKSDAEAQREAANGVVVDISRKRVLIDGDASALTYKEFELLQYLVLREGRTIERAELVSALWQATDADAPGERTIDVHVRRLRAKLGRYEDIVRTVRGAGYRFDRHADVVIRYGHGTPSPDRF